MQDFIEGKVKPGEAGGFSQEVADSVLELMQFCDVIVIQTQRTAEVFPLWVSL